MVVDILAFLVIAGFGYVGWRRGSVLMALSLLGFIAGYGAAIFLYRPVGGLLVSFAGVPGVLAYPIGGVLAMLAVGLTVRFVRRRYVYRRLRDEMDGWKASQLYRGGGAALGVVVAAGIVLVAGWMATVVTELGGRPVPGLADGYTGRAGAAAAEKTIYLALRLASLEPQVAASISGVMARPGRAAAAVRDVLRSDVFASLRDDPTFRDAFFGGDAAGLAGHPMTDRMLQDPSFQHAFELLNVTEGAGELGQRTQGLAATLGTLGGSLQGMRDDGVLHENPLAAQIQDGISSGTLDLVSVTRSPQLGSLLQRINASFRERERVLEGIGR